MREELQKYGHQYLDRMTQKTIANIEETISDNLVGQQMRRQLL